MEASPEVIARSIHNPSNRPLPSPSPARERAREGEFLLSAIAALQLWRESFVVRRRGGAILSLTVGAVPS